MMRKLIMVAIALATVAILSCTETTDRMGDSLTSPVDKFTVTTDTFDVSTQSIKVDSVLSRSVYTYIGRLKDPETGSYITSDYMTQFHLLENEANSVFPSADDIASLGATFNYRADSCTLRIVVNSYQGDSLAAMKLVVHELAKPVEESGIYYTDFNPASKGYLREGQDAIRQNHVYSMTDLTVSDSLRNVYRTKGYFQTIDIPLNKPYTDKNGERYEEGYGSYIMKMYYDHPEYFKNSKTFTRNVCPGFYLECVDGLGVITEVAYTQLNVHFHYQIDDVVYASLQSFNATEEVLQTTHITNDKHSIDSLVNKKECTFLKTPAGIYTEVTLPIEEIKMGHEKDTITSARIVFNRMTDQSEYSDVVLEEPTNLLMIERDSLYSFFEENCVPNNKTSYLATFNSTYKTYTFNNLSGLIKDIYTKAMPYITNQDGSINLAKLREYEADKKHENWNKVVLIPVQVETSASSSSTSSTTVSTISNEMNVNSVRLVGGSENKHRPVRISIIYNKNN